MRILNKKFILVLFVLAMAVMVHLSGLSRYVTLGKLNEHRDLLEQIIGRHYLLSVLIYMIVYGVTALILPAALILTVAGGVFFHTFPGAIYSSIGATTSAVLAFVLSRYVMGSWLQVRYASQLSLFNAELERHGHLYVIASRIVPVFPFLIVNYLCGLTRLPLSTFTWATAVGMLPVCLIYTFTGSQMGNISSLKDVLQSRTLVSLMCLALLVLIPIIWKKIGKAG